MTRDQLDHKLQPNGFQGMGSLFDEVQRKEIETQPQIPSTGREDAFQSHDIRSSASILAQGLRTLRSQRLPRSSERARIALPHLSSAFLHEQTSLQPLYKAGGLPDHVEHSEPIPTSADHSGGSEKIIRSSFLEHGQMLPRMAFADTLSPATMSQASNSVASVRQSLQQMRFQQRANLVSELLGRTRQNEAGGEAYKSSGSTTDVSVSEQDGSSVATTGETPTQENTHSVLLDILERVDNILKQETTINPESARTVHARFEARCKKLHYIPDLHRIPDQQRYFLRYSAYKADGRLHYAMLRHLQLLQFPRDNLSRAVTVVKQRVYSILIGEMAAAYPNSRFRCGVDLVEQYAICLSGCTMQQNKHIRRLPVVTIEDRNNCIVLALQWLPELMDSYIRRLNKIGPTLPVTKTTTTSAAQKRKCDDNLEAESVKRRAGRPRGSKNKPKINGCSEYSISALNPENLRHLECMTPMPLSMTVQNSIASQRGYEKNLRSTTRFDSGNLDTPMQISVPETPWSFFGGLEDIPQAMTKVESDACEPGRYKSNSGTFTADDMVHLQGKNTVFAKAFEVAGLDADDGNVSYPWTSQTSVGDEK